MSCAALKSGYLFLQDRGQDEAAGVCRRRSHRVQNSLNNINDYNIDEALRAVFSRSGFTKGYFEGKLGKDMFGVRRKEDVEGAAPVLQALQGSMTARSRFCLRIWS